MAEVIEYVEEVVVDEPEDDDYEEQVVEENNYEEMVVEEMISINPNKNEAADLAEQLAQERLENYRRKRESRVQAEAEKKAEELAELHAKLDDSDAIQVVNNIEATVDGYRKNNKEKYKRLSQKDKEDAEKQAEFEAIENKRHNYLQNKLDESAKEIEEHNKAMKKRTEEHEAKKAAEKAEKLAKKEEARRKREAYEKRREARRASGGINGSTHSSSPPDLAPSPAAATETKSEVPAPAPASEEKKEEGGEAPVAPKKTAPAKNAGQNSSFQMFKEMECKEEYQKLRMAGFLRELTKLAQEDKREQMKDSLQTSASFEQTKKETGGKLSLEGIDLTTISKDVAQDKIEALLAGRGEGDNKLDASSLLQLQQAAIKVMGEQETVVDLRDKGFKNVTVVGDLHGSLDCLKEVIKLVGLDRSGENRKEDHVVIFGGDYVDRGDNSLEVLLTLMLLKLSHQDTVHLIRGNHEDTMTASIYGFRDEIGEKYEDPDVAEEIWYEFGTVFAAIPIVAWTKQAAIMHGGIPSDGFTLQRVKEVTPDVRLQLKTVVDPYDQDEEVVQGVMWSDPTSEPGLAPNDRGGGSIFGPDIAKSFLDRHDLRYVIRAHEPFEEGTDHVDVGGGKGVVTIFSASNYPNGEGTNLGAVLHLDEETGEYVTVTFDSSTTPKEEGGSGADQYERVLKMFVDDHRSKLSKAFRNLQEKSGLITPANWAQVVSAELDLSDVNWLELQPQLAPATDGLIDWGAFLNKYSAKMPNKDMLEDDQLSLLHEHKDKFLNIFQLLDADGSGTIDEQEFIQGINTLNEQSGGDGPKLSNPEKLWKVFDIDGDGEISIEEFCKGLEQSAAMQNLTDNLDEKEVESLQENHEMLLLAFKYLDTDKSGAIDHEEFSRGIELLNKRLPERNKLGDPDELFKLLDTDGSGDIDLNEFNAMFRGI